MSAAYTRKTEKRLPALLRKQRRQRLVEACGQHGADTVAEYRIGRGVCGPVRKHPEIQLARGTSKAIVKHTLDIRILTITVAVHLIQGSTIVLFGPRITASPSLGVGEKAIIAKRPADALGGAQSLEQIGI